MAMALIITHAAVSAAISHANIARPQLPSPTPISQPQSSCSPERQWSSVGLRRRAATHSRRPSSVSMAALPDPHSFAFLAIDLVKLTDFPVRIELDPARAMVVERSTWALSEEAIKTVYMAFALVFCWGCCVFGSMSDDFYDSEMYRKAGGNGTGHWLYDKQEREERAARAEIWSEDLIKEIEEKAEEVREAEEEKEKEKEQEKEIELV